MLFHSPESLGLKVVEYRDGRAWAARRAFGEGGGRGGMRAGGMFPSLHTHTHACIYIYIHVCILDPSSGPTRFIFGARLGPPIYNLAKRRLLLVFPPPPTHPRLKISGKQHILYYIPVGPAKRVREVSKIYKL